MTATAALEPDPLNHGWRDYGARVGIWRLMEVFDRHGIRPSVLLNSDVTIEYPQIIKAGAERNWAWLAHGRNNSTLQADMPARRGARLPGRRGGDHRARPPAAAPRLAGPGTHRDAADAARCSPNSA